MLLSTTTTRHLLLSQRKPITAIFSTAVPCRSYRYTRYGELYSTPPHVHFVQKYHPVLGEYSSEQVDTTKSRDSPRYQPVDEKQKAVREMHVLGWRRQDEQLAASPKDLHPLLQQRAQVGSVIVFKRRPYLNAPSANTVVGLITEMKPEGFNPFVRVKMSVHGSGVEMKVPMWSPFCSHWTVVAGNASDATTTTPVDPRANLRLIEVSTDEWAQYMPTEWANDRSRAQLLRQMRAKGQ